MCSKLHFKDLRVSHEMHVRTFISVSCPHPPPCRTSCNSPHVICNVHGRLGCHLTTLFGNTAVSIKKRSLLPLLTVLFLFSYGLMTVLIVEQGSTIQSQRNLIKVLLRDSTELWAAKGKAIGDQQMVQAQAEVEAKTRAQAPSTQAQAPSSHSLSTQTPS